MANLYGSISKDLRYIIEEHLNKIIGGVSVSLRFKDRLFLIILNFSQWVYNILEHKSEVERIVFEDEDKTEGFVLLPDMKWDGKTLENMYLLAIVNARDVTSIRDLTAGHISLLKNVRDKGLKAIEQKYALHASKVRVYLHYYPSFYHLHVHFTHINFQMPGWPERNHLVNQVIENISVDGDYYRKVALECVVKRNDGIFDLYKERFNE